MSSVENRFSGLFRTLFPLNSEATIIPPCADDMQTNCYDVPEPYHNLSSRYAVPSLLLPSVNLPLPTTRDINPLKNSRGCEELLTCTTVT
jgi:hypothetical protein